MKIGTFPVIHIILLPSVSSFCLLSSAYPLFDSEFSSQIAYTFFTQPSFRFYTINRQNDSDEHPQPRDPVSRLPLVCLFFCGLL